MHRPRRMALALAALLVAGASCVSAAAPNTARAGSATAAPRPTGAGAPSVTRPAAARAASFRWPPGTEFVPFELRNGLILVRASLRSPSGSDASGLLVFDTGAPGLTVTLGVWNTLRLDTLHLEGNVLMRRRPLEALEAGSLRLTQLTVNGVIADGLLGHDVIGLLGPSLLGDRAIVVDYAQRSLAIVSRSLTLMSRDSTAIPPGVDRVRWDHVRRSQARFGAVLPAASVAVPLRMFPGGRMLVEAEIQDPAAGWRSRPLALLLDTGASCCAIFDDAIAERATRVPGMVQYRDVPIQTVLGTSREDVAVLPRLRLLGAGRDLVADDVEAGRTARHDLPDIEGELPDPVHGLLGYSFLRRFRPIIDYADEVLWLAPLEAAPPLTPGRDASGATAARANVGIIASQVDGRLCVGAVVPGSPAALAGALPGETIVSIDGTPSSELAADAATQLLEGKPGTVVVVIVRRQGMERVLRLTRRALR